MGDATAPREITDTTLRVALARTRAVISAGVARGVSCKSIAIAYEGEGVVGGRTLVELRGAVGAMLPMSEFEAPEKARARFEALLGGGKIGRASCRERVCLGV